MVGIDFKMIFFSIHQLMNYKKWQPIRIYPALKSLIINQTMTHLQHVFEIKVYGAFSFLVWMGLQSVHKYMGSNK